MNSRGWWLAVALVAGCTSTAPDGTHSAQIVYRVEDTSGAEARTRTEVVDVASRYRGRIQTLDGPPPGTASLGGSAWELGHVYVMKPDGSTGEITTAPPAFAGVDTHFEVALPVAERLHLVARSTSAKVAGRDCVQWLSKDPLDAADFAPATDLDRTTSCVDTHGRMLQDTWTLNGRVVRTRTAVSFGNGPDLAGTSLLEGRTATPASEQAPQQAKPVTAAVLAKALGIPLPGAPAGLHPDAAGAVITTQFGSTGRQVAQEGGVFAWTDGPHLVLLRVDRGLLRPLTLSPRGAPVSPTGARLFPVAAGLQVSLLTPTGLLVTVTANLEEQPLLTWLATVRWS